MRFGILFPNDSTTPRPYDSPHLSLKRFLKFWILDYVTATVASIAIVVAVVSWFGMPSLIAVAYVYIPLNALWVARIAFRGIKKEATHRFVIAGLWLLLDIFVDLLVLRFLYSVENPFVAIFRIAPLITYGVKYFAIVIGASLAQRVAGAGPSPRSELASQLSSVPRRRGRA